MSRGGRIRRVASAIRDGWLVVGLTLLFFLALEYGYRAQGAVRRSLAADADATTDTVPYPYASEPWFETWMQRPDKRPQFDPYRGWWILPLRSELLNVDSAGRRVTPQAPVHGENARKVLMFGGSTMWGMTARDSATIAALVAARLRDRGIRDVEVINFAQEGFNATQSVISLLLELRAGNVPAAAVFLEGNNEVSTAWENGAAGTTTNQQLAARAFQRGRRSFWEELAGLPQHSLFVQRLVRFLDRGPALRFAGMPDGQVCADVALYFAELVRVIEGLSGEFGFFPAVFWQPLLANSHKPLTPWEKRQSGPPGWANGVQLCTAAVDSALADRIGKTYFPLHSLFDADTATVFLDAFAHVTEQGNEAIAERIVDVILPALADTTGW